MDIDGDRLRFISQFLDLNVQGSAIRAHTNKACFVYAKYLLDGEVPSYAPTTTHEFDLASDLYYITPDSLKPQMSKLLESWKIAVFGAKDPDVLWSHDYKEPEKKDITDQIDYVLEAFGYYQELENYGYA